MTAPSIKYIPTLRAVVVSKEKNDGPELAVYWSMHIELVGPVFYYYEDTMQQLAARE